MEMKTLETFGVSAAPTVNCTVGCGFDVVMLRVLVEAIRPAVSVAVKT